MFHWTLTRVKFKPDPVSPREDRLNGEAWGVLTWKGVPRPEERVRSADKRQWRTVEEANAKALEAGVDLSAQVAELQAQAAGKTWTRQGGVDEEVAAPGAADGGRRRPPPEVFRSDRVGRV